MRAALVTRLDGPDAVEVTDVPEPEAGGGVLVDVEAVGVSFPDLLLSRGRYQIKPDLPFALGVDLAGVVRAAPEGSGFAPGDRVAGVQFYGGAAETVVVPVDGTFPLPDSLGFVQAAALPMNYLTAHFALLDRGGMAAGDTVLVHGAAGGVGTATLQVARGLGARTIAVVSTDAKAEVARAAGADETIPVEGFRAAVQELTGGRGVDLVVDVVGGDLMTDSLRSLAPRGRVMVLGFAAGSIPEVRVNRLLLTNIDVRGVNWGGYAMSHPGFMPRQWEAILPLLESGAIDPPVHDVRPLEEMGAALADMEARRTTGKTVLTLR